MTRTSCALVRKWYISWHKLWLHLTKWHTGIIMHVSYEYSSSLAFTEIQKFRPISIFHFTNQLSQIFFQNEKQKKINWKSQNHYSYYKCIRLFLLPTHQITTAFIVNLSVNLVDSKQTSEFCDFRALNILCWWLTWLCPAKAQAQILWLALVI